MPEIREIEKPVLACGDLEDQMQHSRDNDNLDEQKEMLETWCLIIPLEASFLLLPTLMTPLCLQTSVS